jgi:sensor histidine kinase YesM
LFYNQTAPDSQDYLITSPMSIQPLSVIAIIPRNEMFLDNDRFSSLLLAEALVAVFLCSILFIAVTKLISAPVEELARQVDSIESLQQLKTVHCTGGKDFLQITAAINHLYARIRQLVASLTQEIQNRKDAELQILHAQINPHFLYNTLDSIGQLCELGETQAASGMVRELSDFYRIGVSKGDTWIPLKEEVLHVTSYLAILQTRFEDFQYQISVPEELEQISVPKIILQPLAENAIYHGIRTMNPGGTISITAKEQNSMLVITVSDDGSGIDEDRLFKIQASLNFETEDTEESLRIYGLKNVHQRIFLSCGSPYGLTIESQLDAGTTVTLCLPLRPCSFSKKEGIC